MLSIDLTGKRAFVAGVADDGGFGFAIAKALAEAGATVCVGTWPPALGIFKTMLERGKIDESLVMPDGSKLAFERIYPLDAEFDTLEDVPDELRENKRYHELGDFTIQGSSTRLRPTSAPCVDIVVHSLANGSEVKKPLLETSRKGYLGAIGVSAYSNVSMVQRFGPIMRQGGSFLSLSYMASERVMPGYGGGMSSAKAALESDTRVLAFEAGRKWGHRVNCICAGPFASRAASAIGFIGEMIDYCKAQLAAPRGARRRARSARRRRSCASPLASGITGTTVYVDKGFAAMGKASRQRHAPLRHERPSQHSKSPEQSAYTSLHVLPLLLPAPLSSVAQGFCSVPHAPGSASVPPPSLTTVAQRPIRQKLPCGQSVSTVHASGFALAHATSAAIAAPRASVTVTRRTSGLTRRASAACGPRTSSALGLPLQGSLRASCRVPALEQILQDERLRRRRVVTIALRRRQREEGRHALAEALARSPGRPRMAGYARPVVATNTHGGVGHDVLQRVAVDRRLSSA